MLHFELPDMSCGHCVKAVTAAVHAADPAAKVEIDLPQRQLRVQSGQPRERIVAELVEAGYTPAQASA